MLLFSSLLTATAWAQTAPAPVDAPPVLKTSVTVNATLSSETPASITVLGSEQLQQTAGTQLDDRLRQVSGFSLFRRTSSVVANPTTQGVSLARPVAAAQAER